MFLFFDFLIFKLKGFFSLDQNMKLWHLSLLIYISLFINKTLGIFSLVLYY